MGFISSSQHLKWMQKVNWNCQKKKKRMGIVVVLGHL